MKKWEAQRRNWFKPWPNWFPNPHSDWSTHLCRNNTQVQAAGQALWPAQGHRCSQCCPWVLTPVCPWLASPIRGGATFPHRGPGQPPHAQAEWPWSCREGSSSVLWTPLSSRSWQQMLCPFASWWKHQAQSANEAWCQGPASSTPSPHLPLVWPDPGQILKFPVLQLVVNPSRSKSNKQQTQPIASPGDSSPHLSLELLPSLSSTARRPQALHTATSPQGPPFLLQTLFSDPHAPGLMVTSLCPEDPRASRANFSAYQPLTALLLPHPLWRTECLCPPKFTCWNHTCCVMVLEVRPLESD